MKVSKEELLHIADLADLNIEEEKIDEYLVNLQKILDFANIVSRENVENLEATIASSERKNVFRKDEIKVFENIESLMANAPDKDQNMFKIPRVI